MGLPPSGEFEGLPPEYLAILNASDLTEQEQTEEPEIVLKVLEFCYRLFSLSSRSPSRPVHNEREMDVPFFSPTRLENQQLGTG